MQFYDYCEKRLNRPGLYKERDKFRELASMKATVQDVSVRAGIKLSFSDVLLMYELCRYEVAYRNVSGWCGVFSQDNFKVNKTFSKIKYAKLCRMLFRIFLPTILLGYGI